ncbi:MAG: T9SS type A sorting domain-containing protein, partial [Planctomycetes bacterium]|nr:T9SS type A sorting domain-containing protein [Planctomycetota bacterium]
DVLGRRVSLLYNGQVPAGRRVFTWDGSDEAGQALASGIYLVRVTDGQQAIVRRITRLR